METDSFQCVETGPTRGDHTLDLLFTNVGDKVVEKLVLPPLQTVAGRVSNHRCIYAAFELPNPREYTWVVKYRRARTKKAEENFARDLGEWDWRELIEAADVDSKWMAFRTALETLTEVHFPLERVRKRSNEHLWINKPIRKLWRRKIRLYKKGGRSQKWWDTEIRLQQEIDMAREDFVNKLLEEGNSGGSFYSATKKLASPVSGAKWDVTDLFTGCSQEVVAERILDYFVGITDSVPEPLPDIWRGDGGLGEFALQRTEDILAAAKKASSMIDGDPLPNLVKSFPKQFATLIEDIFDAVNNTGGWPSEWKTEHLTMIPKNPNPAGLAECRNISCTSIFSKLLEGQVFPKIRKELKQDLTQYGGTPKCGAKHMLIDIWDEILGSMEGGKSAAVLLGVDYEKAFNRMELVSSNSEPWGRRRAACPSCVRSR